MHREIIIHNKYVVYAGKYNTSFIMNDTFAIKMKYMCYEVQLQHKLLTLMCMICEENLVHVLFGGNHE